MMKRNCVYIKLPFINQISYYNVYMRGNEESEIHLTNCLVQNRS